MLEFAKFVSTLPGPYLILGVAVLVLILLGWIIKGVKKLLAPVLPFAVKLVHLVDDLKGEPARDGVEARPGIMARQASVENELTGVRADVAKLKDQMVSIDYQVNYNGGGSMKDAVKKGNQATAQLAVRFTALEKRFEEVIGVQPNQPSASVNVTVAGPTV